MEKKKMGRSVKIGLAAAIAVLIAGASIYATSAPASESITESEAKQIALSEVKGADISHITKFQKDKDDGRTEYDVEIIYDGYEYDFEISAKDGKIFDRSKEKADAEAKDPAVNESNSGESKTVVVDQSGSSSSNSSNSGSSSEISLEEAKSIALSQVSGASNGNITKAEKDYDDGRAEYEIEIEYNGYEYEFEISASSGNILSKDVDRIDDDDDDDWDDRYDD